mmetsp:Transcript_86975/g.231941  ORF Transcript_86975/g.231941 Transcript_86975/m.231941 type:complete len:93 (+) Transcript_86975:163-441(+)
MQMLIIFVVLLAYAHCSPSITLNHADVVESECHHESNVIPASCISLLRDKYRATAPEQLSKGSGSNFHKKSTSRSSPKTKRRFIKPSAVDRL